MELIGVLGLSVIFLIAYKREEKMERFFSDHRFLSRSFPFAVCFVISFLLSLNFSLSPFNADASGIDSSVFLYIGQSMHHGLVPYKDLFDHKGLVLYFIEYLGYLIGFGSNVGVWIIELINLYAIALIFYCTAKLFTDSRIICLLSAYIVLQLSTLPFFSSDGGNLTEEYALPWIALSLYFVVKFFLTEEYKNWHIVAIGFGFAAVFFLRVNMVGLWAALLFSVIIHLIKSKRIAELFKCALLFVLGCVIVLIPILVYLLATDSLKGMIDYYFLFNFSYTGSYSRKGIVTFFFDCVTLAGISSFFIVYSLVLHYKNKVLWVNTAALLIAYASSSISGRSFIHYGIILCPFFIIPAVLSLIPLMEKTKEKQIPIRKRGLLACVIAVCVMCAALNPLYLFYIKLRTPDEPSALYEYLRDNTTEEDDVLFLGTHVVDSLNTNRKTKNKFFFQTPIDLSDKLYQEFMAELESKPSDYIIDQDFNESSDPATNQQKVIAYLNDLCEQGIYQLEKHDDFQVYVRKGK